MAAPAFVDIATGSRDSNATSTSVSLPAGASTGDLLVCSFSSGSPSDLSTTSAGWTKLTGVDASGTSLAVFIGIAGTASPLAVTSSASAHAAWRVLAFSTWSGKLTDVECTTLIGSTTTSYNPPSITPSHGAYDYTALAIVGVDFGGNRAPTGGPSGYSGFGVSVCGSLASSFHACTATAYLQTVGTTTLDPGPFADAVTDTTYAAVTVAIPPVLKVPVDATPDALHITEGASSILAQGATDAVELGEHPSAITGTTTASPDQIALAENDSLVTAAAPSDLLVIDESVTDLVVSVADYLFIEDGSPRMAPPPVSDSMTLTESALVTNLIEAVPDVISIAENPAEVIVVKTVADQISAIETASISATVPAADAITLSDWINHLALSADDAMLLTDLGFNFGDGLRAKGARVYRIGAEHRVFSPNVVNRVNVILAERRRLKVR